MTQSLIVAYLSLKGISAGEIHDDIVAILEPDAFDDADQLLAAVEGVLEGIEKVTLQAVFLDWMDRLRKCITTNGEYAEYAPIDVIKEWNFILPILRCSCPGGTPCRSGRQGAAEKKRRECREKWAGAEGNGPLVPEKVERKGKKLQGESVIVLRNR
jgi:hypothetical protein